jgi:hypothetical protein
MINVTKDSHPMVVAAHGQGQNLTGHVTGGNSSGSGLVIGNKSCVSCKQPTIGGKGGATSPILGPGGENPLGRAAIVL